MDQHHPQVQTQPKPPYPTAPPQSHPYPPQPPHFHAPHHAPCQGPPPPPPPQQHPPPPQPNPATAKPAPQRAEKVVGPITLTVALLPGLLCCCWCTLVILACPVDERPPPVIVQYVPQYVPQYAPPQYAPPQQVVMYVQH